MAQLFLVLVLAFICSCGKAPSLSERYRSPEDQLKNKSSDELILEKYDNQVTLQCQVKATDHPDNSLLPTSEKLFLNLPSEESLLRILNFQVAGMDSVIVLKLAPLKFHDRLEVKDELKRQYLMKYSPVQKISYLRGPKTILKDGSVHLKEKYTEVTLFENIPTRIFSHKRDHNGVLVSEEFNCELKSLPRPEYKDQWIQI